MFLVFCFFSKLQVFRYQAGSLFICQHNELRTLKIDPQTKRTHATSFVCSVTQLFGSFCPICFAFCLMVKVLTVHAQPQSYNTVLLHVDLSDQCSSLKLNH